MFNNKIQLFTDKYQLKEYHELRNEPIQGRTEKWNESEK